MRDQDRPRDTQPQPKDDLDRNEGEGSPSSARRYEEELEQFKREKNVEELAEEAAKELEDEPEPAAPGTAAEGGNTAAKDDEPGEEKREAA